MLEILFGFVARIGQLLLRLQVQFVAGFYGGLLSPAEVGMFCLTSFASGMLGAFCLLMWFLVVRYMKNDIKLMEIEERFKQNAVWLEELEPYLCQWWAFRTDHRYALHNEIWNAQTIILKTWIVFDWADLCNWKFMITGAYCCDLNVCHYEADLVID